MRLSSVSSTNILHQPSSIHLIPAGTALVDSPLELGIRSSARNDSVAYVRTGRCLIQPAATVTLSNPTINAILQKQGLTGRALGGVLNSGAQLSSKEPQGGSQRS